MIFTDKIDMLLSQATIRKLKIVWVIFWKSGVLVWQMLSLTVCHIELNNNAIQFSFLYYILFVKSITEVYEKFYQIFILDNNAFRSCYLWFRWKWKYLHRNLSGWFYAQTCAQTYIRKRFLFEIQSVKKNSFCFVFVFDNG